MKKNDIVPIKREYTTLWREAKQIFITAEKSPIYTQDGAFLFYSRLGMLFALISEDETSYTVLTLLKDVNGHAHYTKSKLSKKIASLLKNSNSNN